MIDSLFLIKFLYLFYKNFYFFHNSFLIIHNFSEKYEFFHNFSKKYENFSQFFRKNMKTFIKNMKNIENVSIVRDIGLRVPTLMSL